MGMEKIDFIWYLKRISWIALIGYFAGALTFIGEKTLRSYFEKEHQAENTEITLSRDGIKEYLTQNTFYIVQDDMEERIFDSTSVQFTEFNQYQGLTINSYQSKNDTLLLYDKESNMVLSDFLINTDVADTIAEVMFGNQHLLVTKSGMVYFVSEAGPIPLQRKKNKNKFLND